MLQADFIVVVHGLLPEVESLVVELRLYSVWTSGAVAHELSSPMVGGMLVHGPGIEPMSFELAGRFLTTGPPEKSLHKYCCHPSKIIIASLTSTVPSNEYLKNNNNLYSPEKVVIRIKSDSPCKALNIMLGI